MRSNPSSWAPTMRSVVRPAFFRACKIMEVTVVFPWLPATTMRFLDSVAKRKNSG